MRKQRYFIAGALFGLASGAKAQAVGKPMNPDVSVGIRTHYEYDQTTAGHKTGHDSGMSLDEVELQFLSDVDPYLRASALLTIDPVGETVGATAGTPGVSGAPRPQTYEISPEEVYVETIDLPVVTLKVGKFKADVSTHNTLHEHAWPFIDQPLVSLAILGDEGMNGTGISAAALAPLPWFSELTVEGFQGSGTSGFSSLNADDIVSVARWRNLWDLTDDLTMDLGISHAQGSVSGSSVGQRIEDADLTFKWRPAEGGKYASLAWATQYMQGNALGSSERVGGLASWIQYQFAERWWASARADYMGLGLSSPKNPFERRLSVLVGFAPSEFSNFRLQYEPQTPQLPGIAQSLALQMNIVVGAHPAHAY